MKIIDLRSDTVTQPSPEMRRYMVDAPAGDDVYSEDPTVNRLEAMTAELVGKESAIFASSGTQSNLLALLCHCGRGDEYIVGQQAHTYKYEGGGAAVLGSIQPQPLDFEPDATFDLGKVRSVIKPQDVHFARTKLICLENTHNGKPQPLGYAAKAKACADEHGLGLHLDGARLFNAAVYHQTAVAELCQPFDSISICLSKGLGAPVGSVLCGSKDTIKEARHWRKMLGGGMRQAGLLAAGGIYSLTHNVQRLADDHENAAALAEGLASIDGILIEGDSSQTNMVFIQIRDGKAAKLQKYLGQKNIIISGGDRVRLVTHLDVGKADIVKVVQEVEAFYSGN